MPIQSTTTVDTTANAMTLLITQSASTIESIVYTLSTDSLTFSTVNAFSLSAADFLIFAKTLDIFKDFIIKTFGPGILSFSTFNVSNVADTNDGINTLGFSFSQSNHPLYSKTATYPFGSVTFSKRNQSTTLTREEWLYYHVVSSHFEDEIHRTFRI